MASTPDSGTAGAATDGNAAEASSAGVMTLEGRLTGRDDWTGPGRCSMERALELVGTRSAMLLLREAYYGARRFEDLARRARITEAAAATRLRQLVADGLLERRPYREDGQRTRHEYLLTDKGRDLHAVFVALVRWGDTHIEDGPVELAHAGCGAAVDVQVRCRAGHDVGLGETVVRVPRSPRAAPR
ncbi:transcriptional regulator, HxlR family [Pseudonocardia dioxanivorans CB1190]|uniref:Transcriptional regulator, HxlR family n=1 Tax=Pseudonocardia dioxanivorans (strain ATCC 55486 / DSM 44775 / JCM 13855 / CB1190) TaxID=675635 RepID=F4CLN3_PSEUX|nr:helix-turn-helix domain-containing protein [Pseudonocardia dioxanivorans]AEA27086.1 transcriptional regulator, HxlR family [Pseudonocardia dioxanivorans CB1190]